MSETKRAEPRPLPAASCPDARGARRVGALGRWRYALATGNVPDGPLDPVTRWLVLVRASVLPMTLTAGFVAGLLAGGTPRATPTCGSGRSRPSGIVCAHMANNLMNDLFDLQVGTDRETYPRTLYAPHPVLSGMTTRKGLAVRALVVNVVDLAILVVLVVERGWPIARVRARRLPPLGRLHRAAAAAEEARARRADGASSCGGR